MKLSDFLGKFQVCSDGHNEVLWCKENHPQGCPVCSQIARVQAAAFSGDNACKLRDANIEIERLKMCFHQQQSFGDIQLKMCREKDEVNVMKGDYFAMKKQRDDLIRMVVQKDKK